MRMRRSSSSVVRAARAHSRTRAATVVKSIDALTTMTVRRDATSAVGAAFRVPLAVASTRARR